MALQGDRQLAKVGILEGFSITEEKYGYHTRRSSGVPSSQVHQDHCHHQYYYQQAYTYYWRPQVSPLKEVVNNRIEAAGYYRGPSIPSNEAAQLYGGVQYIEFPTKKETVITSDQAAQMYGGIVVTDYPKRKPLIRA